MSKSKIIFSSAVILFLLTGCGHWALVDKPQDANGNLWVKRGFWLWNDLYYCNTNFVSATQKDEPTCYEAKFYQFTSPSK